MNHEGIADYEDDNMIYISGKNIDEVVRFLEEYLRAILKWFSDNQFQANEQLKIVTSVYMCLQHVQVNIRTTNIKNSSSEKLLCITIDAKLNFEKHIEQFHA